MNFGVFAARQKSCPDGMGGRELFPIHGSTERPAILVLIVCFE
jgi:hypothetical protein